MGFSHGLERLEKPYFCIGKSSNHHLLKWAMLHSYGLLFYDIVDEINGDYHIVSVILFGQKTIDG